MKGSLKSELWKAFHNKMFLLALAVGCLLVLGNVLYNWKLASQLTEANLQFRLEHPDMAGTGYGFASLFFFWLLVAYDAAAICFYSFWPVLAALPYGWSYLRDRKSGVYDLLVAKQGRKAYFRAKYAAVFLSGGAAVAVPALLDLLINGMILPAPPVRPGDMMAMVYNGMFLSLTYYRAPWLFCLAFCGLAFLWGGVTGTLCLAVGTLPRLQVLAVLLPYLFYYVLDLLYTRLKLTFNNLPLLSPMWLIQAAPEKNNPGWALFGVMGVIALLGMAAGYWQVTKHEFS